MSSLVSHTVAHSESNDGFDYCLLGVVLALLGLGIVMVYSATAINTSGGGATAVLRQHVIYVLLGLMAMYGASRIPVDWWYRSGKWLLGLVILLLMLVIIPAIGIEVNGSRRWIPVGPVRMQPAELAKLVMVIYAAGYLTRKQELLKEFRHGVVGISVVIVAVAGLLLWEPDFGSFVVIAITLFTMMFLAGARITHFMLCATVGAASMAALTIMSPYRMQRVLSFLNPWSDPFDSGFQLSQALIAFGRGEWFGVGLGASIQKLFYLPHASNDFLLAVIGEELGLLGVVTVLLAFATLVWRAFAIARRAETSGQLFAARLAQGVGLLLGYQAMINIGVNMGVLPTKGLTLPFLGYGGSSLVICCAAAGLLLAVDATARAQPRRAQ